MSETAQRAPGVTGGQPAGPTGSNGAWGPLGRGGMFLVRQREATVFLVVVLLIIYFGVINTSGRATFFTRIDLVNLSQIAAPIMIIAYGEVLLLICGEIDLSVGFIYAFAPYVMHFFAAYYGVPGILAVLFAIILVGAGVGWINAFLTVTLRLPSFITTLGTGFVLAGLILTMSHGEQAAPDASVQGIGKYLGTLGFAEIIWAVGLLVVFHLLLRRTRWGLHTIAVGGNLTGAREAGINVARIKYGNFMITGVLGAFVGIQIAFQTQVIDTFSGGAGYQSMFYAVAAAVIGGTAMLGGSGTIIGAFLGAAVLAILTDGFEVIGVSAYPLEIFFGGAILLSMIVNVQFARLRGEGRVR
ncbi:MAG: Monosaccharide-transporting ATPase [Actinomycetia bacterium]|nr:Monosaccharide-transporting ATPase [Actinomycetes bacterium]